MCQTTAPLTKKSSHLLWNVFSQWFPLGLASVEERGEWCLITFGSAIFCSVEKIQDSKCLLTLMATKTRGSCFQFSLCPGETSSFGSAKESADTGSIAKVKKCQDVLGVFPRIIRFNNCIKWPLEHHETLELSTEGQWKWDSSSPDDTPSVQNGWKYWQILNLLMNH